MFSKVSHFFPQPAKQQLNRTESHGERPARRAARRTCPRRIDDTVGDELPADEVPWHSGANRTRRSQLLTIDKALAICCRSAGETRRVKTVRDGGRRRRRHPEWFRGLEFWVRAVRCCM